MTRTPASDFCRAALDESHDQFREVCAGFVKREIAPHAWEWEEAELFDRDLYRKAAEAGLLGPALPEELGGAGGDLLHVLVSTEELIRGGCVGAAVGLGSLEIALPPILTLGTPEQQQRLVPPVLAGERIAALAITEPGAGSDVAGVRTRAVRDGDDYVLDGSKLYVTSGVRADQVTVLARTGEDPHGGLTFFVVEAGSPGYTVSRALKKTGWRASDTAELVFEGLRVPAANRLGDEGSGFFCLMQTFRNERLYLAAQGYAIAEVCLEEALNYARQREAFGRKLTGFQTVRHRLVDMATQTLAAKSLCYQVTQRSIAGTSTMSEVAMLKNLCAQAAFDVSHAAVQVFGGMGYMRETLVERLSRDARLLSIGGGTTEVMKEIVSKEMGL
jgi:acyl-CoA dehydrogenase